MEIAEILPGKNRTKFTTESTIDDNFLLIEQPYRVFSNFRCGLIIHTPQGDIEKAIELEKKTLVQLSPQFFPVVSISIDTHLSVTGWFLGIEFLSLNNGFFVGGGYYA